jgi:hypothetical protein
MQEQVISGTWEEVSRLHGKTLAGHHVEIRVLDVTLRDKPPRMIYEGMFPELSGLTEADFKDAEWHPSVENI